MKYFDWNKGFVVDFDLETGRSAKAEPIKRTLSQMKDFFMEPEVAEEILKEEDPLIYEYHDLGGPDREGDLAFGTTILYPGKVGNEYFLTKGHFHTILDTAEIYYALQGEGVMVMENMEGDTVEKFLRRGEVVYVPRGYAHRTVNTGKAPFVLFYTFAADAGHDYGTIEKNGYSKCIVEKEGKAVVIDNPKREKTI